MNTNTKHTPTPWYRNIRPITKYPIIYAGDSPNHSYCFSFHVPREVPPDVAEANVDFVLRACNSHEALVEALESAAGHLDHYIQEIGGCDHSVNICCCEEQRALEQCRAALKLAKGE